MKGIKANKIDTTTISGVACYILLIIYYNQINDIESVENLQVDFESNLLAGKLVDDTANNKRELASKLVSITDSCSILISAFRYLKDKDFLRFDEIRNLDSGYSFYNFYLTANGVNIIERGKNNQLRVNNFAKTFNLKLSFNIDSFVKANNIVGAGGAVSAGIDV